MSNLPGKRIVLGVSGGIAAYKAVELASRLVQARAHVDVVMTEAAREFVAPLTFQTITKHPVHGPVFEGWSEQARGHVSLAEEADALVVAPATANTIAKLALGLADDMLSVTHLAATPRGIPFVVAPAMEPHMFQHVATQSHLATLRSRGAQIVGPAHGRLASGAVGLGRMSPPEEIVAALDLALGAAGALSGRRIVVSAGGTQEALDPVRVLTNRSSGKMGYAIAQASLHAGADVTLISTPTGLPVPFGAKLVPVVSALDLLSAVEQHVSGADALIMAAAVADYRPATTADHKIKKHDGPMTVELVRNPDILATVATPGTLRVGFAAETQDIERNARDKLQRKNLDMIVANDARLAMGSDDNAVTIYFRDGRLLEVPTAHKDVVATRIVEAIAELLEPRG
ncbi:MAG: bifunctional phosphopantothenoylcysteine decarboxylase/phosphopantothenate--cysteine ligase CoaBC [Chloroflexi bacterium]|nr:MAG: bifunctional phosphopantothenoylcysteine decarboxylase/phosphopantothenate--cysteine ligase CoaBC [Chloroflexota bacterium]